jgi:hypothetical protein
VWFNMSMDIESSKPAAPRNEVATEPTAVRKSPWHAPVINQVDYSATETGPFNPAGAPDGGGFTYS